MIKDIKNVIAALKADVAANATFENDVTVVGVSLTPSAKDTLDYVGTLTLNRAVRGMYAVGTGADVEYRVGLTNTVVVPMGTLITLLCEALIDVDDENVEDDALDIVTMKKLLKLDAEKEALSPVNAKYISQLTKLLVKTKINIITRDVKKGKVTSLFSLNDIEREAEYDSVWHDIYGLSNLRAKRIVDAAAALRKANEANATAAADAKVQANALADILAKFASNNSAAAIAQQ